MVELKMNKRPEAEALVTELAVLAQKNNRIDPEHYQHHKVFRGLRASEGDGVLVGLTEVGDVHGYLFDEGFRVPDEGRLIYRGIRIEEIVNGYQEDNRFGFEEVAYLLLFGELPNAARLKEFSELLDDHRTLPEGFIENMILKAPSSDIMNKLARSVLVSYSYDKNPDDIGIRNVLRQCIELIAQFPTMAAYGYQAKSHYYDGKSLFIHRPIRGLSTAENLLHLIRPDSHYTRLEAETLDLALVLHAEHGGGNNSTFTLRVVTSTDTDTYSAVAAGLGSLKGPKHGGANMKVVDMMEDIMANVKDWADEDEVRDYLVKILQKQAFDRTGLVYGIGHAVYTKSDPRAILLKEKARDLAREKGQEKQFLLQDAIERLVPRIFHEQKGSDKVIAANVDFYSGFVYSMLNIPKELYTPIFSIARIAGWSAHRIEELITGGRIIRPAYRNVAERKSYVPLAER